MTSWGPGGGWGKREGRQAGRKADGQADRRAGGRASRQMCRRAGGYEGKRAGKWRTVTGLFLQQGRGRTGQHKGAGVGQHIQAGGSP